MFQVYASGVKTVPPFHCFLFYISSGGVGWGDVNILEKWNTLRMGWGDVNILENWNTLRMGWGDVNILEKWNTLRMGWGDVNFLEKWNTLRMGWGDVNILEKWNTPRMGWGDVNILEKWNALRCGQCVETGQRCSSGIAVYFDSQKAQQASASLCSSMSMATCDKVKCAASHWQAFVSRHVWLRKEQKRIM